MKELTPLFSKILDIIISPTNTGILAALTFASFSIFSLNFLPERIIERINLMSFLEKYSFISIVIFIVLGSLLIGQFMIMILKMKKRKRKQKEIKKIHEKLFSDPEALHYLLYLYKNHPNAAELPYLNQKVKILSQYGLIVQAINQWPTNPFDPRVPYILQSFAEERIKKDIETGILNIDDFIK